jgi:hypothetical protein
VIFMGLGLLIESTPLALIGDNPIFLGNGPLLPAPIRSDGTNIHQLIQPPEKGSYPLGRHDSRMPPRPPCCLLFSLHQVIVTTTGAKGHTPSPTPPSDLAPRAGPKVLPLSVCVCVSISLKSSFGLSQFIQSPKVNPTSVNPSQFAHLRVYHWLHTSSQPLQRQDNRRGH